MRATWYLTEDGKTVDPAECSRKDGVLTHESGAKIAMRRPDCPRSRGVDVDAKGKLLFAGKGDHDGNQTVGGAKQPASEKEPVKEPEPVKEAPAKEAPPPKTEEMKPAPKPAPAKRPGYKTRGK